MKGLLGGFYDKVRGKIYLNKVSVFSEMDNTSLNSTPKYPNSLKHSRVFGVISNLNGMPQISSSLKLFLTLYLCSK
jgi:hypothetical protein